MDFSPFLIVISSPSGGGKTSITQAILKRNKCLKYSVSATTRPKRNGEVHGQDYFFLTEDEFKAHIERDEFAEWAIVHKNFYGTPLGFIIHQLESGYSVVMDIDIQGARLARQKYPDAVCIFVVPPSLEILEKRLRKRATDSEEVIQRRLVEARQELKAVDEYDYIVVNRELEASIRTVEAIIMAEQCRTSRALKIPHIKKVEFNLENPNNAGVWV